MTTTAYPMFSPVKTTKIHGHSFRVHESSRLFTREFNSSPSGCTAFFLHNNAQPSTDGQFGIKVYRNCWDAIGSFERQKIAARNGAAPPVRGLVMFEGTRRYHTMYGYETGLANEMRIPEDAMRRPLWIDRFDEGPPRLRRVLRAVDIRGACINDLQMSSIGPKCVRVTARMADHLVLGGDLHVGNLAKWKGKVVCIDFGYHSVMKKERSGDSRRYTYNQLHRRHTDS